jgi:cytochrome c-type biogenesis protein CcmH
VREALRAVCLAAMLALSAGTTPAWAVRPDEMLSNPALEERARALSKELRCLVCQNESIDDSSADLAHDLRVLVRDRIKKGDTDQQALAYIVARYGEFVLLKPRFDLRNAALWGTPVVLLLAGGLFMLFGARRRRRLVSPPLSSEEKKELETILSSREGSL